MFLSSKNFEELNMLLLVCNLFTLILERIIYKFGKSVMDADSISFSTESMRLSEFEHPIDLPTVNPYDAYQS